jgi:proline racemase
MRLTNMITAIDLHACGEPGRVITGGILDVPGKSMFEKMKYFEKNLDDIRLRLLREPRGYPALCANVIMPPTHPDADAGFIIMEQVEYPPMSGTNTICVATALLETGMLPMKEPVTEFILEAPAGLVGIRAECKDGKVTQVIFKNVPGTVTADVAWGGMFYVIADAAQFGLQLTPDEGRDITRITEMLKAATAEQYPVVHPDNPDLAGPTIGQLSAPPTHPKAHRKNVVTVSTGKVDWNKPSTWTGVIDRSPCGTGTCARMATMYARGQLNLNQDFIHEGILGTLFTGQLVEETQVGSYRAVVPTIGGTAWITAINQFVVDPSDPYPNGFTIGDIW